MKASEKTKLDKIKAAAKKVVEEKAKKLSGKRANFKKKLNYNLMMVDLVKRNADEKEIYNIFAEIYKKKDAKVTKDYIKSRIEIYRKNAERIIAGTMKI